MRLNQEELTLYIINRLEEVLPECRDTFKNSEPGIGYFVVDKVLPEEVARTIENVFPPKEKMKLKRSLREDKYVASQMNNYDPLLEQVIYAFQDLRVVNLIERITEIPAMQPDENLYAGGISLMGQDQFLNPHLDNSHDKDRNRWRVLNLLYYVSPEWKAEYGGNLELWPEGLEHEPVIVPGLFNRLVVMATHDDAYHSVSPITANVYRRCISNYYFAEKPLRETDHFHVTSFRARPGNVVKDTVLKADTWLRMRIRQVFKKGIVENPHVYKKEE